jgi:hypothetical protein
VKTRLIAEERGSSRLSKQRGRGELVARNRRHTQLAIALQQPPRRPVAERALGHTGIVLPPHSGRRVVGRGSADEGANLACYAMGLLLFEGLGKAIGLRLGAGAPLAFR